MTAELAAFARARLDDDEHIARKATPGPWRYNWRKQWHAPQDLAPRRNGEEFVAAGPREQPTCVAATGPADDPQSMTDACHIARHDPARVLAEVAAKRAIVDRYQDALDRKAALQSPDVHDGRDPDEAECDEAMTECLAWMVRHLAAPHSSHPDYREEWRP